MKSLWGRKVTDLALYQLINILKFKTTEHQKTFHQIDRFYPSSKKCSCCGAMKDHMPLNERVYICQCGLIMDRDLNACINILSEGASSLGLDDVRQSFGFAVARLNPKNPLDLSMGSMSRSAVTILHSCSSSFNVF